MSYLPSFGPTTFDVSIGSHNLNLCIELTATSTPGTYNMSVGEAGSDGCSKATLRDVATVTLDENGNVTSCNFSNRFGSRNWKSMTGSFGTDGTGSGSIEDDSDPTGINGLWQAGGTGQQVPRTASAR